MRECRCATDSLSRHFDDGLAARRQAFAGKAPVANVLQRVRGVDATLLRELAQGKVHRMSNVMPTLSRTVAMASASAALLAGTATVASAAGAQSAHSHGLRGGAHSNARIHDEPRIGCGLDDGGAGGTGGNGGSGGTGRTG